MPDKVDITFGLLGLPLVQDKLHRITGPNFVCGITSYNGEITGYAQPLGALMPKLCKYSYQIHPVLEECKRRGYEVEEVSW